MPRNYVYDYNDETKKALDEGLARCGGGQLFGNIDDMLAATKKGRTMSDKTVDMDDDKLGQVIEHEKEDES